MDSALFTACLDYLIQDIEGKIFLIADRARYHTPEETARWLKEHEDRIELFFLPSYSPDLSREHSGLLMRICLCVTFACVRPRAGLRTEFRRQRELAASGRFR